MARLASATPVAWVARVAERPLELLADHAHCELRAAASARALSARHADDRALVERLGEVEAEEREHHAAVLRLLAARGGQPGPLRPNAYAQGLLALRAHRKEELLLDRLLICCLIEARSLERFHLLAEHLPDAELREFYAALVPAEAAHRALFVELAKQRYPHARVLERLAELTRAEGELVARLAFDYRMHSGHGAPGAPGAGG